MFDNFGLSKKGIINTAIRALQSIEEKSPTQSMSDRMSMTVMKDPEVGFVLRTFSKKYELPMVDICIEPVIEEKSLAISKWVLKLNRKTAFEADGCQALVDMVTGMVLERDIEKVTEHVATIERVLQS